MRCKGRMPKIIRNLTAVSFLLLVFFAFLNRCFQKDLFLTLAITFATCFYHFAMRLATGLLVNAVMHNRADCKKAWYRPGKWEIRFYDAIRVKRWKNIIPSYRPDFFSPRKHTWEEIASAMCQAEVVHEIIIVISFFPLLAARVYGAFPVFFVTSLCAAFLDLLCVIVQRYNRPRVMKLVEKELRKG